MSEENTGDKTVLTFLAQQYGLTVEDLIARGTPRENIVVEQPDGSVKPA